MIESVTGLKYIKYSNNTLKVVLSSYLENNG